MQNAHLEAYDDIYVQNNESVKSTAATTTVGQRVINAALAKYQTPQQFGDATMQVTQTTEGQDAIVTIKTRDFEQNGAISADGGVLSWEALKSSETIVDHIDLSTNSITINKGDTSSPITATAYSQNNQEITGKTATFTSSDTNIATVNENGVVTGVTAGTTTITVTIDGKTVNCSITVNEANISFIYASNSYEVPSGSTWEYVLNHNIIPHLYEGKNGVVVDGFADGPIRYNGTEIYKNDLIINNGNYAKWCCFDPDMKVLMADKTTKKIIDVEEGDLVLSLNEDTGEFIPQKVNTKIIRQHSDDLVYVYLSNGTKIGMRAYHPLLTEKGWKSLRPEAVQTIAEAGENVGLLQVGDKLVGFGENPTIVSIEYRDPIKNYNTYNLSVEGYHNYIIENVVVHNAYAPCNSGLEPYVPPLDPR